MKESQYCKGDGKVTFARPFVLLDKVTFDEHGNTLEMSWKWDISDTFTSNGSHSSGSYMSNFRQCFRLYCVMNISS